MFFISKLFIIVIFKLYDGMAGHLMIQLKLLKKKLYICYLYSLRDWMRRALVYYVGNPVKDFLKFLITFSKLLKIGFRQSMIKYTEIHCVFSFKKISW